MSVLTTVPFTIKRFSKNWIVLLLLFVVPIVLITVFGMSLNGVTNEHGEAVIHKTLISLTLVFQLFGGSMAMSYVYYELFTEHRFRLLTLPLSLTLYAFSLISISTVFSIVLGAALVLYSLFVFDVAWGNFLWILLVITCMATLSSIICLIFTFSVKNFKIAERLSEIYGIGAVALAGLFFPLPDLAVIQWVNDYLNPLTLAQAAVFEQVDEQYGKAWLCIALLLGQIAVTFFLMLAQGRRRMP